MRLFAEIKDRRTIVITESQSMDLLLEVATVQDIYQKYYSDIPQDIFQEIISADPTYNNEKSDKMGKYGKWLLSLYQSGNLKVEDLYKAKDYLSLFARFNGKIEQKDIMRYRSLTELYNAIEPFMKNPKQAATKSEEVRNIKQGAEKVYEDEKWLVVVPHTKEASCYYGKGTQWCTAADRSNNMFEDYNSRGLLYINILKGTDTKYQFHFESDSFMDAKDQPIELPIAETIGLTKGLVDFYVDKYGVHSLPLTTEYDLDEMINVHGLDGYYVDSEGLKLFVYNKEKANLDLLYDTDDYDKEIMSTSKMNRFIPIIYHPSVSYSNLYDIKYGKLLFDESQYFKLQLNGDNVILHFKNGMNGIYSLKEMRYTTTSIPKEAEFMSVNKYCAREGYSRDLAIMIYKNQYAPFSFLKGNILSNGFYKHVKKEGIYSNAYSNDGKVHLLNFISFYNNDAYNDADILLKDGALIPLPQLAQNADEILSKHIV